mmetsp:Transcript_13642/g.32321  ORF Transcript_13642/g.32321 Transcript_13642/m.32321 type:complete len:201 (+) Transcript_13642:441-1043(+)
MAVGNALPGLCQEHAVGHGVWVQVVAREEEHRPLPRQHHHVPQAHTREHQQRLVGRVAVADCHRRGVHLPLNPPVDQVPRNVLVHLAAPEPPELLIDSGGQGLAEDDALEPALGVHHGKPIVLDPVEELFPAVDVPNRGDDVALEASKELLDPHRLLVDRGHGRQVRHLRDLHEDVVKPFVEEVPREGRNDCAYGYWQHE